MRTAILVTVATIATAPGAAGGAQTVDTREEIDFDRPEAWAMKYFGSITLMTGMGPPRPVRLGSVRLALDGQWVPELSQRQRTVGFNGTKAEALNQTPVYGHLRLEIGLPFKITLTLSYLPPIPIAHLEPNLFAFSLAWPIYVGRELSFGIRAFGQVGWIKGQFTCSEFDVQTGGANNPLGCTTPSHDQVNLNYGGAELSGGWRIRRARNLEPYVSIAGDFMDTEFRVGASYGDIIDRTQLHARGATFWGTTGLIFPVTRRFDIGAELFYSPLTVRRPPATASRIDGLFNVRAQIAYRF